MTKMKFIVRAKALISKCNLRTSTNIC